MQSGILIASTVWVFSSALFCAILVRVCAEMSSTKGLSEVEYRLKGVVINKYTQPGLIVTYDNDISIN